jgi:hypothetical protein
VLDTWQHLNTALARLLSHILSRLEDLGLEPDDLLLERGRVRDTAPLFEDVNGAHTVRRVEDVVKVKGVGLCEQFPSLDDGGGGVDEGSVHVKEDRLDVDVDDVGVGSGGHGAAARAGALSVGKGAATGRSNRGGDGVGRGGHGRHGEGLLGEDGHGE